jgi:hypothetical protein
MKTYMQWAACFLYFMVPVLGNAANSKPFIFDCAALGRPAVKNLKERVEITAQGFSFLPPQGEDWCMQRLKSGIVIFYKTPAFEKSLEKWPTPEQLFHTFVAHAMTLDWPFFSLLTSRKIETNVPNSDELKTLVEEFVKDGAFAQVLVGISSGEHTLKLIESNVVVDSSLGTDCVRFDATIEERGHPQAPGIVFILNARDNVLCRHPVSPEVGLIWLSFAERYVQGDQPLADTVKQEFEPFLKSLQFMLPR